VVSMDFKIVYTIKRHTNMIMFRMHHDLLAFYKGKDVKVFADYEKNTIELDFQDQELADAALKDINSMFGIGKMLIAAFVKTKVYKDGKEVI